MPSDFYREVHGDIVYQYFPQKCQEEILRRYTSLGWGFHRLRGGMDRVLIMEFIRPPGQEIKLPDMSDLE